MCVCVCVCVFHSLFLSYVDLSECHLASVPRGLPASIRYLQLRRNNMTAVRRASFADCPFVSILVLDENDIAEVGRSVSALLGARSTCRLYNNIMI